MKRTDLRGTWPRAIASLLGSIVFILAIRWALFEPYVIPSGSMLPTLLIHDHIFVNKFAYGFRLPFANKYLVRWDMPKRGDILVFREVGDDEVFLVKRVIGLPGDTIELKQDGLYVNGTKAPLGELTLEDKQKLLSDWTPQMRQEAIEQNEIYIEDLLGVKHPIFRDRVDQQADAPPVQVPEGNLFMSGDNRDHSADSRMWGTLPVDRVLGRASIIWLSCEEALAQTNQLCNPQTMRWRRLLTTVH